MIDIVKQHFDSWDGLSSFIDKNFTYFNNFRFRGQADSHWKLETSLTRELKKIENGNDKEYVFNQHLINFKQNLRGRCKMDLNSISENEILAIGQHFGLNTPLLDWTFSSYVGLFFAMQGKSTTGERCLWAINESLIVDINKSNKQLKDKIEFIKPLSNENPRLVSQQGLFLRLPLEYSLEELLQDTLSSNRGNHVYQLTFDDTLREDTLANLNNMNINHLTLFPDLIGSSLHTNYLMEIEPFLQNKRNKIWKDFLENEANK